MSSDNIKVVVRARPRKKCNTEFVPWKIHENKIYQIDEDKTTIGDTYAYDEVFNENTKNADIYNTAISSLVCSAIAGINLTIFAYGATSSGKTYTMNGTPEDPGIIPRFIEHIFEQVELYSHRKFLIRVSYVEIYSEIINDLLDKSKKDLKIREDTNNCVSYNPKEEIVKSTAECMNVMKMGAYNRTVGETQMNLCSSRSHAIFRIVIESAPTTGGENDPVQVSHVNLIDLAGSERASQTGATGQRFKEGAHINKSLTALGLVMKQLVEKNEYINYRDSKLTRILSNSLGGNTKTLIICNINLESLEDTASTLMFAQRAKAVKNKPKVNEVMTEAALTKRYAKECSEIKKLLESELEKNKQLEVERDMSNKKISEMDSRIKSLEEIFVRKDPVIRPPKRRHTFCTLGVISEERELENASRNLATVGLQGEGDTSRSAGLDYTYSPPRRNSVNDLVSTISNENTPTKNLRERLEILTREHEELIEYTRSEKCDNQILTKKYEQVMNEYQNLKLVADARNQKLKLEEEKVLQMKIDYEFTIETQKKKFERRESELLEQISKLSTKTVEVEQPSSIENLPISRISPSNTFEYEEMSEKMASCQRQIEEMQKNSQTLRLENEDLNVIIADLRKSVNSFDLQNSQLKIKNKSLQTKVLDMELKVNNSQQVADSSNNDIDSLKKQIQRLEENNKDLKTELGRLRDELFESQDKLIEVTEDLDIEEKKALSLKAELNQEKELRQNIENQLHTEKEIKNKLEAHLGDEKLLRQQAESELEKEKALRQEVESELAKEKTLGQEVESELVQTKQLIQENESKKVEMPDSNPVTETNSRLEIELQLMEETDLRQKLELELFQERELLNEAETKYFEEVNLRKDVKLTLCTLKNILEPGSQRNKPPTVKANAISLNVPKESVSSEYYSVQETSEILGESYLDISDPSVFTTPNESMQEIDQDNLESFSSSYFKDDSKSHNFIKFFGSLVSNDNEASGQNQSIQARNDEKEEKYDCNVNEVEKLRIDLNAMKSQRESDISTINKLQAQLEEYSCMNLSDSQKIIKTNKILEALNLLETEKAENLSLIQTLKEQIQNDTERIGELERFLELKSNDLERKTEEIQILNGEINFETKLEEREPIEQITIQMESFKTQIEEMDAQIRERDTIIRQVQEEKNVVESQMKLLLEEKNNLEQHIETQSHTLQELTNKIEIIQEMQQKTKTLSPDHKKKAEDLLDTIEEMKNEIKKLSRSNEDKEGIITKFEIERKNKDVTWEKLTKDTDMLTEEKNKIQSMLKEECERNDALSKTNEKLQKESESLSLSLKEKETIIININEEKNSLEKEIDCLTLKINDLHKQLEQLNQNDILSNQHEEKIVEFSNRIKELENEIEKLSSVVQDKEKIIVSIDSDKMNLLKEKTDLSDEVSDLILQVQEQTNRFSEFEKNIEEKQLASQEILQENDILKKKQELIYITLEEEQTKNANLLRSIEEYENKHISSEKERELIIEKINKEKTDLEEQMEKLTLTIKDIETLTNDKQIILMENSRELKNEIEKLSKIIQDKENIISIMNEKESNSEEEIKDMKNKTNILTTQAQTQADKLAELSEIIENKEIISQKILEENIRLKTEFDLIHSTLNEERERNAELKTNIDKLENENTTLSKSVGVKESIIKQITTEKMGLEKQRHDLSAKINDLLKQIDEQNRKIRRHSEIIENNELCLQKLTREYEKLTEENKENKHSLKSDKVQHEDLIKNIEELKMENIKLSEINSEKINEIRSMQKWSKNEKDLLISKMKTEQIEYENEKERLLHQVQSLKTTIETQVIKIKELQEAVNEKEIQIEKLENYKRELEQNMNNKEVWSVKEKERVQILVDELKRENSTLMESLEVLQNVRADLENKFQDFRSDCSEKLGDFISKMKPLLGIKQEKTFSAWELQLKLETKWTELKNIENQISTLIKGPTATINDKSKIENSLKSTIEIQVIKIKELQEAINDREKIEYEKERLLQQVQSLKTTIETQVIKIKELQEAVNEKEIQIEKLENYKRELEQNMNNKEVWSVKEKERVQILVDELKRENSTLMESLEVLQNVRADLENKFQDFRSDCSEKLGDFISKMKPLLGIKQEKTLRAWELQLKLETKWTELKNIENQISILVKGPTATINDKSKIEDIDRINKKLTSDIHSLEEQKKYLQTTLGIMKKEHDEAIASYEEKLHQENKKLKAVYAKYEQDKRKIENLEYELQAFSKKSRTSNHVNEKDASDFKISEGKWKQQRAEAHDSRRSIDLNTLCSESTAFRCRCEDVDEEKIREMKSEISQLKEVKEVLSLKYEKAKRLCRIRHDEINQLHEKLKQFTST